MNAEHFMPVEALVYISEKDLLYEHGMKYGSKTYEKPTVIHFDQGHRPPRRLEEDALKTSVDFFVKQYRRVNNGNMEKS